MICDNFTRLSLFIVRRESPLWLFVSLFPIPQVNCVSNSRSLLYQIQDISADLCLTVCCRRLPVPSK